MKTRTKVDFSKHIVLETHFKSEHHNLDVWDMKQPDSNYTHRVTFINSCGIMSVKGDFGNWVFCREFHPSADGGVSGGYWDEKLQISSVQKAEKFDTEETQKQIKRFKKEFKENYGRKLSEEEKDWVENLESASYDEHEYIYTAYRENPSEIDYEDTPFGKKHHFWLDVVYDAFDELCRREKIKTEKK